MSETPKRKVIRRKRVKKAGALRFLIIVALITYAIVKLVQWNFAKEDITYSLEYGDFFIEDDYRALVIRKELILTAGTSGELTQVANEGEKVKKNQRILVISKSDNLTAETITENLTTDTEKKNVEILSLTVEKVQEEIAFLKEEIADKISKKDYESINSLAEDLKLNIEKSKLMIEKNAKEESSYSESEVATENLEIGESVSIEANEAGILTYYIDGYESELTYKNVISLEYSQIEALDIEPDVSQSYIVKAGDPICKIVDDSSWYIIIVVKKGKQNNYDINKELEVQFGSRKLTGYIEEIFPTSGRVAIAIKFEETVENFYRDRFMDVKITQGSYDGLKIKKSSLVSTEEGFGVYVVDKLKKVSFKPVSIIQYGSDYAIVREGAFYEIIDGDNTRIDTVSVYDRVIIDSEGHSSGEVID